MNRKYISILFLLAAIIFNSCKHDNFDNFVGPALCPSSQFKVVEDFRVSQEQIDFNKKSGINGDSLTAKFNEVVTWTITIKGNTSGAFKEFRGRSIKIDTVWFGQSNDPFKVFKTGETATVSLQISCLADPFTKTVTIVDANRFKTNVGPYALVTDFDGAGPVSNSFLLPVYKKDPTTGELTDDVLTPGYNASGWSGYFTPSSGVINTFGIATKLGAPQGTNYMTMTGDAKPTSWFVGGCYVNTPTMPGSDPNNVYFNAYINSGSNLTTSLGITLIASKKYTYVLPLNWQGWKMVALKVSDFKDASGNSMTDATKIGTLDMGLNCASKQGQSTEVNIDFIMFSNNGPFFK